MNKKKNKTKKNNNKKQKTYNKLYDSNKNPKKSIKNTGYSSKEKAIETLKIIKTLDIIKQKQIVITMYNRAKYHKYQTKGMRDAMNIYKKWMKKYNIKTGGSKKIIDCCKISKNSNKKKCIRKKDSKIFKLPRKFSKKKCKNPKGFSMISSCSPYKYC